MRDQIDCIKNLVQHIRGELNELEGRCNITLGIEETAPSAFTNSAMDAIALVKEFARCGEKFTLESAYMAQLIDQARGVAQRHQ